MKKLYAGKTGLQWLQYLLCLLVLVFCIDRARKGSDFDVYLAAAKTLLAGGNPYDAANTLTVPYFYSSFFALVLAPFTFLPAFVVKLAWLLFSVYCIYRIWKLVQAYYPVAALTSTQKVWWIIVSHAILAGFYIDNFHMVQVTFFMIWASLEAVHLISTGKTFRGALLLGLAINIKIMPILFLPYLFYRGKWKGGFLTLAFILVFTLLPHLFLGSDYGNTLLQEWWTAINPISDKHSVEVHPHYFDLPAFVAAFFTTAAGELTTSFESYQLTLTLVRLFFVVLTLAYLQLPMFKDARNPLSQGREIAYLLLATVLLFPHQNKYANVYLMPALAYVFYYLLASYNLNKQFLREQSRFLWVAVLLLLVILLLNVRGRSTEGTDLLSLLVRYRGITIGTMLLAGILLLLPPSWLLKRQAAAQQAA
ncbi:glycosyltransferase family 87 protein [Paraflavitalea pollutisoli]|uniref:glycosyltransferase family 87 protein n=1 Tax=Paraflavitalea pollutisoli TaxID=3034143 RepID=UPI0023EB05C9|nr:glycosyltransferase family 87 protein [Paraflavitalea sp. H1-2-19X]